MVINPGGGGGTAFTQGTLAARPAASPSALYYATDTGEWWIADAAGSAWQSINQVAGGGGGTLIVPATVTWQPGGPRVQNAVGSALDFANVSARIHAVGKGLMVAEGANAKQGTGTLVAGAATIANTSVTANSRIFVTSNADGGAPGFLRVSARVAGTSFTVTSSSGTDTSTFAYEIFEPG